MDVPGIVQSELDGEDVAASVSLGGEDALYVTPTRTLIYRSESLLSDESVEEYPHDAERVTVKDGRRKTRITLTYNLDGERDFTVPSSVSDDVLHPVLAGVLNGSGITDAGETVVQTFRFSELTLIVTSDRLLKHVGSAVWDDDHEQYHFEDVTGLDFEEGSVATQIVLEVDGRPQRIKTPNEHIAVVRERLTQALFAYYDVDSIDALNALVDPDEDVEDSGGSPVDFGEGVDPLGSSSSGSRPADTSGDPFHDDEQATSLVDDDTATHSDAAADGRTEHADAERDPRRPVSGDADARTDDVASERRRAESGSRDRDARRAEPADSSDATAASDAVDADVDATADVATSDRGNGGDTLLGDPDANAGTNDAAARSEPATDGADAADAGNAPAGDSAVDASEDGRESAKAGEFAAAGFEPATESGITPADLAERIDSLEERVDAQNALLEQQQALIQQLIQELRER